MRPSRSAICRRGGTSTSGPTAFTLQARLADEKQCILVLIGATREGRKELVIQRWCEGKCQRLA